MATHAHPGGYDPEQAHDVPWSEPGVGRVVGLRFADAFGSFALAREPGRVETIDGRRCLVGGFFAVDVEGLHDIDGQVDLTLVLDRETSDAVLVGYDANVESENLRSVTVPAGASRWAEVTVRLERARFAGRGPRGTDLLLGAPGADFGDHAGDATRIAVASLRVRPAGEVAPAPTDARLELRFLDEGGVPTAARIGVYAADGREVLPGGDAVPIRRYGETVRQFALRSISAEESGPGEREAWPHPNRWAMYVDGTWSADVAAGTYEIVAAKGPEYRWSRVRVDVPPGAAVREDIRLTRWSDLPSEGWRSGDAHIHLPRDTADDPAVLAVADAEDIGVANLLQMGNLSITAFGQPAFGPAGRAAAHGRHLVSGQEDPRTGRRGHTLHLDVAQAVRDPARYFLYHETLERLREGGAITGYAHAGTGWFDELAGLALDVPFGLVDLIEVAQAGLRTDPWYDFLNLGYRLTPVAGSDWPYINAVGTVRSYVNTGDDEGPDGWFAGLRAGRTFVTDGPLLSLTVDGAGMGDALAAAPGDDLTVRATARLNPDIDVLDRMELVVQGDVAITAPREQGRDAIELEHTLPVTRGTWVAVRAFGVGRGFAHSAPVYVPVADGTWRADVAERIVARMKAALARLLSEDFDVWTEELEPWDTHAVYRDTWLRLLPELEARAERASRRYDELLARIESTA
jgi:hypothetical protein